MMKKLLVMLMALMMFAVSGYAEKSEAEVAKESFNAMVSDITGQIEASYKAQDSAIRRAPDDNETKRGCYSDGKLYSSFNIYLIKNYKNSPHMWH